MGESNAITGLPMFDGLCDGCGSCVSTCPGLAMTLVDFEEVADGGLAKVTVPFELALDALTNKPLKKGDIVHAANASGNVRNFLCSALIYAIAPTGFG